MMSSKNNYSGRVLSVQTFESSESFSAKTEIFFVCDSELWRLTVWAPHHQLGVDINDILNSKAVISYDWNGKCLKSLKFSKFFVTKTDLLFKPSIDLVTIKGGINFEKLSEFKSRGPSKGNSW
jgi:hypothetical protein